MSNNFYKVSSMQTSEIWLISYSAEPFIQMLQSVSKVHTRVFIQLLCKQIFPPNYSEQGIPSMIRVSLTNEKKKKQAGKELHIASAPLYLSSSIAILHQIQIWCTMTWCIEKSSFKQVPCQINLHLMGNFLVQPPSTVFNSQMRYKRKLCNIFRINHTTLSFHIFSINVNVYLVKY